jgi:hypothetical protein
VSAPALWATPNAAAKPTSPQATRSPKASMRAGIFTFPV